MAGLVLGEFALKLSFCSETVKVAMFDLVHHELMSILCAMRSASDASCSFCQVSEVIVRGRPSSW